MKNLEHIGKQLQMEEISSSEEIQYTGGKAAELMGLGIAAAILGGYFGPLGMVYAYYNYFKD